MLNAQYHKNQNYNEIKTHHYLISFDPADKDECGLTGEQAQVRPLIHRLDIEISFTTHSFGKIQYIGI